MGGTAPSRHYGEPEMVIRFLTQPLSKGMPTAHQDPAASHLSTDDLLDVWYGVAKPDQIQA
jgi:hypothetical protein